MSCVRQGTNAINDMKVGFIGQGYVGKNYADAVEAAGYETVRYALEEPYRANREQIKECDIVIIGVPTPTTPDGFDASIVTDAIGLAAPGSTVVIKSTVAPGTTARLQEQYPDRFVFYSPEFLSESTAAKDVQEPFSSIVGIPNDTPEARTAAERVIEILPKAPYVAITTSTEAELIKYLHNLNGYFQIILSNVVYDLSQKLGADWEPIMRATQADPYIGNRYAQPVHKSGRGAGGHCFIKDFAAFRELYEKTVGDALGTEALKALEAKNVALLRASGKDLDLVNGVYGQE